MTIDCPHEFTNKKNNWHSSDAYHYLRSLSTFLKELEARSFESVPQNVQKPDISIPCFAFCRKWKLNRLIYEGRSTFPVDYHACQNSWVNADTNKISHLLWEFVWLVWRQWQYLPRHLMINHLWYISDSHEITFTAGITALNSSMLCIFSSQQGCILMAQHQVLKRTDVVEDLGVN